MIFLCLNFEVSFVCKYLKVEVYFVSLVCGNLALFGKTKPSEQRKGGGRGQRNKGTDHWIQIFVNIFIFLVEERGEGKVPVFTAMTATSVKSSWPACTSYIVRSSRFQVGRGTFLALYIYLDPGGLRGDRHGDGHPGRAPRLRGVPNHPMGCVAPRGPVGLVGLGGAVPTMLVGLVRDGCRAGEGGGQGPDHC